MHWEQGGNIYFVFCIKKHITALYLVYLRLFDVTAEEPSLSSKAKSTPHILGSFTKP